MRFLLLALGLCHLALAGGPEHVLVIANRASPISEQIARYYMEKREIPASHLCEINAPTQETIDRTEYGKISAQVGACLQNGHLAESILYLVTTLGVPLRVEGGRSSMTTEKASVDSELCLLYSDLKGQPHALAGPLVNPFFRQKDAEFKHPDFPVYLVTRLAGYDFADVKGLIDRALLARNVGKFVIDMSDSTDVPGNDLLRTAAIILPESRVILDESVRVLYRQHGVIGYASWGSNDGNRHERQLNYQWLPGAIMTEFVSTNARTFERPPANWQLGSWNDSKTFFGGTPQSLIGDYIHEGVTGASGHVYEPYLAMTPRPDLLLPAYYKGRNLAESFYLAIPGLSWQNIVVGDPLCRIGPPLSGK